MRTSFVSTAASLRPIPHTRVPAAPAALAALAAILALQLAAPVAAQSTLERAPGFDGVWVGLPWALEVGITNLVERTANVDGVRVEPAFAFGLGLPGRSLGLVRFAPQPRETGGKDDLELALRRLLLDDDAGGPLDLALEAGYGTADGILTGAVSAARWLGPLRVLAAGRGLLDADTDLRLALGGGAVWHPLPGSAPIALAGEAATFVDRAGDERIAWRAGFQLGVAHTTHTLSLYATNAGASLLGRLVGTDRRRVGLEVTAPIPVGRILGLVVARAEAMEAVRPDQAAPVVVTVPIRDYRYLPDRIVIRAGTAVEWINQDDVVHTASADDGSWNSGGLETGERWRAVFDRPGIYPYHCGPHPYMRAVVIVR